jgi:hypothetical protein
VTAGASVLHGEQRTPTAERADRRITAACVDPALGPDAPKLCMFALTSQAERQGLQVLRKYFAVRDGQRWAICVSQGEPFATPSEVVERLASFDRLWALDEAFDLAASVAAIVARNGANWPSELANAHSRERYERDLLVQGAIERIGRAKGLPMETVTDWTVSVSELAAEMGLDELRAAFPDRVVEERDGALWMGESTHLAWNIRVRREEPVSADVSGASRSARSP